MPSVSEGSGGPLATVVLSRATKAALVLLIIILATLLLWAQLSDSNSDDPNPKRPASSVEVAPAKGGNPQGGGTEDAEGDGSDDAPPAGSLRQRSLK